MKELIEVKTKEEVKEIVTAQLLGIDVLSRMLTLTEEDHAIMANKIYDINNLNMFVQK